MRTAKFGPTARIAVPVAALALTLAACSDDDKDTTKAAATTAAATAPGAPAPGASGTQPATAAPSAPQGASSSAKAPAATKSPAASAKPSAGAPSGKTYEGLVQYMAPGKYTVGDTAFFIAVDTKILGGGAFCPTNEGISQGYGTVPCTEDLFEEAAKSPQSALFAKVAVDKNGIATTITEKAG